jgi:phage terminase large subunit GpA-like protein
MRSNYADAGRLVLDALQSFLPPAPITVAEWTAEYRYLSNEGGGHVGRWDNAEAPYLIEPMQALTDPRYTSTAIVGPGQCGKTEVANNWMLHGIDTDPASMLRFMQTEDALRSYVKDKINPAIEQHEQIKLKQGLRPIDDSIGFKRFRGMTVQFLAAARSNLISKSAARIVCDEIDAYDPSLGDVKNLVDVRRQTFGRDSMALFISHPDRARGSGPAHWNAGIMAVYADSTRCTWWWPCPECGAYCSPNPGTARHMVLHYPLDTSLDRVAAETRLLCPVNGCLIEDHQRRAMNRSARWIGRGESIAEDGTVSGERIESDTAGYWIVGAMSPFLLHGIGGLAAARVKAERAVDAGEDDTTLREVMTKQWGIPFDPPRRVGNIDAATLADRAEPGLRLGVVPEGVRFLTAGADVQAARFEGLVRGWGAHGESWIIDHWSMAADTATSPADWDAMIARLLAPVLLADGSGRRMRVHAAGYDSGGAAGVTTMAYQVWLRAKQAGAARLRGKVDGRDAWSLLPLKGMSTPNAQRLAVVYPDSQRKDRRAGARGQIPTGQHNPNRFKDDLANQLARAESCPWAVHVPYVLRGDHMSRHDPTADPADPARTEPPHRFFEQLVAETRTPRGVWETPRGTRNEALDLMVMTHIMASLHGLIRLRWDTPRAWYADWDHNSGVFMPEGGAPASPAPGSPFAAIVPTTVAPRASRASRLA